MRLVGFCILVNDMGRMIRFYRDVLGFEIKQAEDTLLSQHIFHVSGGCSRAYKNIDLKLFDAIEK